jgi:hypothetical protein
MPAHLRRTTLLFVALLASPDLADAQEYRATLTGLVTDAQGLAGRAPVST